ncbi:DUF4142 domain-containing protein [Sphingosinicella rhizophila]|uniref:DUF4142 domain-containing protein n=1 Tax=Sphingosinicella rhizophila TaxID=3050082 RepID=A0ABU3Q3I4_9SPHN|nr:DUF4142 domain-containing protein [Sphingosinicella sp. GR2756]MDT9597978.1 DUF4142 domain-containing protein [Sphingosinicella sp. GR2756]
MNIKILAASAAILALAACGGNEPAGDIVVDNEALNAAGEADPGNMSLMTADPAGMPANGQEYSTMAAASDMYEIESSRLAIEKSQNDEIKELARMIVADHEKSTADLKDAAGRAQPPIEVAPAMNPEQQANMEALRSAADQFDQTYLQQQVSAHQKALAMVQAYAASGEVEPLKQHAANVSGPIQKHLERAQELAQQAPQ